MVQRSARWNPSMNTAAAEASVWAQMENTSLWPLLKWKWRWWVWMAQKFSTTRSVGITSQRLVCTGGQQYCTCALRQHGWIARHLRKESLWTVVWSPKGRQYLYSFDQPCGNASYEEWKVFRGPQGWWTALSSQGRRWRKITVEETYNFMKENMDFTTAPDLSSLKTNRQSSMKGPKATETMQTPNQTTW